MYYKVKKLSAFLIIGVLLFQAIMPTSIRAEGSDGVETREISSNILADKNTTFEGAEGDGIPYWWYGSSADLSQSEDAQEGNFSMKVEPTATGSYAGGASNVTDDLKKGTHMSTHTMQS